MRISPSPSCDHVKNSPLLSRHRHAGSCNVAASAKFLMAHDYFFATRQVLLMPCRTNTFAAVIDAAKTCVRGDGCVMREPGGIAVVVQSSGTRSGISPTLQQVCELMDQSLRICASPVSIRAALSAPAAASHLVILMLRRCGGCLFGGHAIWREVSGRQPVRGTGQHANSVWLAFVFLMSLIAADNFLWRIASWIASFTFVGVTGDLRRDMFRHLTGHAPSYFSDRLPGMLTSRITATSNAIFTVENMFVWNVLPPCIATIAAISLIGTVSLPMAAGLIVIAGIMVMAMFHLAAAGKPLHDDFADKAAAVDGEMVDVINNMPLVRAFCGLSHEHDRFDATVEPGSRRTRPQPALSRKAAAYSRGRDRRADRSRCSPGASALAAGRRHHRRCRADLHARPFHPECDARSCGGAGRCHPACRADDRSDRDPVAAA